MTRCCRDVLLIVLLSVVLGASFAQTPLPDFLKAKLLRFFFILDANGDGVIQQQDYHVIFGDILGEPAYGKYNSTILYGEKAPEAWGIFPQTSMNQAQLLDAAAQNAGTAQLNNTISDFATLMFDIYDYLPSDGALNVDEFKGFFQSLNISTELAPNSFNELNPSHDGKISLVEFIAANILFFSSNDPKDSSRYLLAF